MANEEHLKLLREGVDVWNAWRAKEPLIQPNLYDADLSGAKPPRGVALFGANLHGADLSGANLSGAIFSEANLSGATLFPKASGSWG